jgi:hypothetical protein
MRPTLRLRLERSRSRSGVSVLTVTLALGAGSPLLAPPAAACIAAPIVVAAGVGDERNSDIAYNSSLREYLAVWQESETGSIAGEFRNRRGLPIAGRGRITILRGDPPDFAYSEPAAVFKRSGYRGRDTYLLVAKRNTGTGRTTIVARRISDLGDVVHGGDGPDPWGDPAGRPLSDPAGSAALAGRPDLTATTNAGSCCSLVVWNDGGRLRVVHFPPALSGPSPPEDDPRLPPPSFTIGPAGGGEVAAGPAVASQRRPGDQYLVVYGVSRSDGSYLAARVIRPGSRIPGREIDIADTDRPENPDVAYNELSDTYLVVIWPDRARILDALGDGVGDEVRITPLATIGVYDPPVVATARGREVFFVAYESGALGGYDLFGSFLASTDGRRIGSARLSETTAGRHHRSPALAYGAGRRFTVVWHHQRTAGTDSSDVDLRCAVTP